MRRASIVCAAVFLAHCGSRSELAGSPDAGDAGDAAVVEAGPTGAPGCATFVDPPLTDQAVAPDVELVSTVVAHFAVGAMDLQIFFPRSLGAMPGHFASGPRRNDPPGIVSLAGGRVVANVYDRPSPCERDRTSSQLNDRRCSASEPSLLLTSGSADVTPGPAGGGVVTFHDLEFAEVRVEGASFVRVDGGRCLRVPRVAVTTSP